MSGRQAFQAKESVPAKKSSFSWLRPAAAHPAAETEHESPSASSPAFAHNFTKVPVRPMRLPGVPGFSCPFAPQRCPSGGACHTCPPKLQAKLKIGQPGDRYEQEADRVAEQVMRMPEPQVQRKGCSAPGCKDEDEDKLVQAKSAGSAGNAQVDHPLIQSVLSSPGQPLDAGTRSFMEPRFGQDFSGVRMHLGGEAAESARAVNARAYTVGRDVVFGEGQYAPGSDEGKRLVAHELAHVGQQADKQKEPMLHRKEENNAALAAIQGLPMYELLIRLNGLPENILADEEAGGFVGGPRLVIAMRAARAKIERRLFEFLPDNRRIIEALPPDQFNDIYKFLGSSSEGDIYQSRLNEAARAYTVERNVVFGEGQYAPGSDEGKRLVAHELAHVVQQQGRMTGRIQREPSDKALRPPAAANAYSGIDAYYMVEVLPYSEFSDMRYIIRVGDYILGPNMLRTDPATIVYYIAYRRSGQRNEWVVGPASVDRFVRDVENYERIANAAYAWVPPGQQIPAYQASSARAVGRAMKGDIGGYFSGLGDAWGDAARDPGWWMQAITATAGALASVPVAPRPPALRVIPGGGGAAVTMPRGAAPILATEGNAALAAPVSVAAPAPVVAPRLTLLPGGGAAPAPLAPLLSGVITTLGTATMPGTASLPHIGPRPNERKRDNQTCTNEVLDGLQSLKDSICNSIPSQPNWSPSRTEKMLNRIPCSQIRPRLAAFRECVRIRQDIQDMCFGGKPDPRHQKPLDELQRSIENGEARLAINCAPGHPMANR